MKRLILILFILPLVLFGQFDGQDTLHAVNIKATGLIRGINLDGYFNYSDSATVPTPISYTSGDTISLPNDGKGGQDDTLYKPYNISNLWDTATNQFDFTELSLGDEVFIRFNLDVTTSAVNQEFSFFLSSAIGGSFPYTIADGRFHFKNTGIKQIGFMIMLYIGSNDTKDNPSAIMFTSDANATITINSFYISTKRRM